MVSGEGRRILRYLNKVYNDEQLDSSVMFLVVDGPAFLRAHPKDWAAGGAPPDFWCDEQDVLELIDLGYITWGSGKMLRISEKGRQMVARDFVEVPAVTSSGQTITISGGTIGNLAASAHGPAGIAAPLPAHNGVAGVSHLPARIKVLFFAANSLDLVPLRLDEEIRDIEQRIRSSRHRDSVELVSRWAVRPADLLQALNEHQPHVVHFSGHGSPNGDLVFQDPAGNAKLVGKDAIVQLMNTMTDNIRVVVFNSCFSRAQAEAVTRHIDVAIGMSDIIDDEAARVFAAQFYSAIGFGRSVRQAFDQATALLNLEGLEDVATPELYSRAGVDPRAVVLVEST